MASLLLRNPEAIVSCGGQDELGVNVGQAMDGRASNDKERTAGIAARLVRECLTR